MTPRINVIEGDFVNETGVLKARQRQFSRTSWQKLSKIRRFWRQPGWLLLLLSCFASAAEPSDAAAIEISAKWFESATAQVIYLCAALVGLLMMLYEVRRRRIELAEQGRELLARENRLHMAVWGSGDQFWDWDLRRGMLIRTSSDGSGSASRVMEIPIDLWQSQVHPDDIDQLRQNMIEHVEGRSDIYESEHRLREGEGWRWVLARGRVVEHDRTGAATRISGTSRDITQSRLADQDRRIATQVLRDMDEAVTVFDLDFRFVSANPAFSRMTGWGVTDVVGESTHLLDCPQHGAEEFDEIRRILVTEGSWSGELWQRRSDSSEFASWTQLNEVRDPNGVRTHYVAVVTDVTERRRNEQKLLYLANYDLLTGLPNRTLFTEKLSAILSRQPLEPGAVLYLDLDHFKHVNDSFGHAAGDRLLKAAGDRLRRIIDQDDTVSRLGGDEFAITLERIGSEENAAAIARRVQRAFALPINLGDAGSVTVTPSIGVSLFPRHGIDGDVLLRFADAAMYQAKSSGRNTFLIYTEEMETKSRRRAVVVAALGNAIDNKELHLEFQPRMSLTSGRISGVEALLRWTNPELGIISPGEFIPYAEETGLILSIGDWVMRETCSQVARWRSQGVRGLSASINVSMLQLQRGNVAGRLAGLLDEFAIPADQIEIELTESMVMANAEQSIGILQKLRDVGVTISIDDFGTGYSSLAYLKRLPIDTLKIDQTFVGDICIDPDDRAITATIIAMGRSLGLNVVAEGVETSAQIDFLREHHCDEIQGYWLSRALRADDCFALLQEHLQRRSPMLGTAP